MKKLLLLTVLGLLFAGCEKESEYDEVSTVIVASTKLDGLSFSSGTNIKDKVYAIKENGNSEWTGLGYPIIGFEYQEGTEYVIEMGKKRFHDPEMATPVWFSYYLINIVSQTQKTSEGLPENFIPDWWEE